MQACIVLDITIKTRSIKQDQIFKWYYNTKFVIAFDLTFCLLKIKIILNFVVHILSSQFCSAYFFHFERFILYHTFCTARIGYIFFCTYLCCNFVLKMSCCTFVLLIWFYTFCAVYVVCTFVLHIM